MSDTNIRLVAINDILGKPFYVPAYQRGYRWTERQVINLLDDLSEFAVAAEDQDRTAFYCLQPVVVLLRDDGSWELVDGQQRLTTIFLILRRLDGFLQMMGKQRFTLTFETRESSAKFLEEVDPGREKENIDFYHICKADRAIEDWFAGQDGSYKMKLAQCLTNTDKIGKNARVIWYELPRHEDAVLAFTRLNVGKIPLTNAELVRALFLRESNFNPVTSHLERTAIAQEWDAIEKTLQNNEVWYFLHDGTKIPPSRIEYLFQLIAREADRPSGEAQDNYGTFYFYHEKLSGPGTAVAAEWLMVKQYFMRLEEWFSDRILYHLVGFLVHDGDDLVEIRKAADGPSKTGFRRTLKQRIFERLMNRQLRVHAQPADLEAHIAAELERLDYEASTGKKKIRSVLLLFNIATLLQNRDANLRFPFDRFKEESWDLEHIRAVATGRPNGQPERRKWINDLHEYFAWSEEASALRDEVEQQFQELRDQDGPTRDGPERFNRLYDAVLQHFGESDEMAVENGIGNLTLLDSATNRGYKNAVFPVKRKQIIDRDKDGVFVPLCTKNVFMKCYSKKLDNMLFWTAGDMANYQSAIAHTLATFFCSDEAGAFQ
ncbi:MAG TPA: DUF262 domain-containing protein [Noviherbaspirillum sp.]|uniref:DUF262 domain-containing protein n=1 Tax=Noviherbaspirillum sp. TaxID=1926288 RepID=UPI002B464C21|nr:DUF262 domain-containing protein [Noviherbaspirillum sp.]HJV84714.1 DUF262 domain-containing protein [Noviherbaspirillum sp.]